MPKYKNILLINAWQSDLFPPPGIGYLQAAIKKHLKGDVNVTARDIDEALQLISEPNDFDLIAVSFHSFSVKYANIIRNLAQGKTLICGGHHPSAAPQQMIAAGYNYVLVGEGENSIIDFIYGKVSQNVFYAHQATQYFSDIDEIPDPDYTGLKVNVSPDFGFPIISSRGCPFVCNFCASSLFWERKIKIRSAEKVLQEIEANIIKYEVRSFMFEDDNFTIKKSRTFEICEGIKKLSEKYGQISWQCASRADVLNNDEMCVKLKESGCHTVWLGIESFSQDSLNRCNKNTTAEKLISGITNAESHGLKTMCQFIIGLPGDTIADINETCVKIKQTPISRWGTNIAWVLPNTEIYHRAKKAGFDDNVYLQNGAPFYTYEQSIETLQYWARILNEAK